MTDTPEIQKRRMELWKVLYSHDGERRIEQLYRSCFGPDAAPPPDGARIETILKHEFQEEPPAP